MKYLIFLYDEVDTLDFSQILETDPLTMFVSLEGKSILKYEGEMPSSVQSLKWKSYEYTHQEILNILYTEPEWQVPPTISENL
jgi:hypothetical protein